MKLKYIIFYNFIIFILFSFSIIFSFALADATEANQNVETNIIKGVGAINNSNKSGSCKQGTCIEESVYPESQAKEPNKNELKEVEGVRASNSRKEGYLYYVDDKSKEVVAFSFQNKGPNNINPNSEREDAFYRFRSFEFEFPERARQGLQLWISDQMNSTTSKTQESILMFFPRKVVPAVVVKGEVAEVILPTGEKVNFAAKSFEITGGVLSEQPIKDGQPARVAYSGKGVLVRIDARGNDPRIKAPQALITKPNCEKGEKCKVCKVTTSKLWGTEKQGQHFKYASDEKFNEFLKTQCGFGFQ